MKQEINLINNAYKGRSSDVSSQRNINLFIELLDNGTGEKTNASLVNTPGLSLKQTITTPGVFRGAVLHKGDTYFVAGSTLYKYSSLEVLSTIGSIPGTTNRVSLASSGELGSLILIVDGTNVIYTYNSSTSILSSIASPYRLFQSLQRTIPTSITYMNGFFIINDSGTGQFYISDDGITWNSLDAATAERDPDNIIGVLSTHKELLLIGENTTEPWYVSGSLFPFSPSPNVIFEAGTTSKDSIVFANEFVIWLASTKTGEGHIVLSDGASIKTITTPQIEFNLSKYTDKDRAYAFSYYMNGALFYEITFPVSDKTWLYCVNSNSWSEIESYNSATQSYKSHIIGGVVFMKGKHYAFHKDTGNIYLFSQDIYDEAGTHIRRERVSSHIVGTNLDKYNSFNGHRMFHSFLDIEVDSGVGLANGQGSDPKIMVDWSDDGGYIYKNKRYLSMGKIGEYSKRIRLAQLGSSRDRLYRMQVSDPVKVVIQRAILDMEGGTD